MSLINTFNINVNVLLNLRLNSYYKIIEKPWVLLNYIFTQFNFG